MRYLTILVFVLCFSLFCVSINNSPSITINDLPSSSLNLQTEYQALVQSVSPSMVEIRTYRGTQPMGIGSGFMVYPRGLVVTNYHVVKDGDTFYIKLWRGIELKGKLLGTDPTIDIAVIEVAAEYCYPLKIGDSSIRVGSPCLVFGSPLGLIGTVTSGIISSKRVINLNGENIQYIQTSAAISPGNSGGPLVSLNGELIGINTFMVSNTGGNINLGFCIPSSLVMVGVEAILEKDRGLMYLGIIPSEDMNGVTVLGVIRDSPADKAGIVVGDIIEVESKLHLKIMLAHGFHKGACFKVRGKGYINFEKEPERAGGNRGIRTLENEVALGSFQKIVSDLRCPYHDKELLHCGCTAAKSDISYLIRMITSGRGVMPAPVNLTVWIDLGNVESIAQYKTAREMQRIFGNLVRVNIRHRPFDGTFYEEWLAKANTFESLRALNKEQILLDWLCAGLAWDQAIEKVGKGEGSFDKQIRGDFDEGAKFEGIPWVEVNRAGVPLSEKELEAYIRNYLVELSL